ncbi:hypothetical protein MES5069_200091 [Mesorhizobium escarrei]|uniref:Uncharacterized protein n=1 Tax=Mesorhizobium escarrei TaxID=666018 RepID=A0ABM9DPL0_9HYPH|nr:hypothetical protein MES5069_200091 [Mesorhizobium escarrei]
MIGKVRSWGNASNAMPHSDVCFWETAINVIAADMRRIAAREHSGPISD